MKKTPTLTTPEEAKVDLSGLRPRAVMGCTGESSGGTLLRPARCSPDHHYENSDRYDLSRNLRFLDRETIL